jgi:TRAP-type C4-dicarboxylate transport system permease small subunit
MKNALQIVIDNFYRLLEAIMVVCMAVMFVLVFINVMMRIFLNSGLDISEELPRFAYVWMTFLGAVIGVHKHSHLGVDMLITVLPMFGRKVCWGISQIIMALCSLYMLYGTWLQHEIISINASPVMQVSLVWVYGVSYVTGTAITIICLSNLMRLFLGQVNEKELIHAQEDC